MLLVRFPFSPDEDRALLELIDDTPLGVGAAVRGTLTELAILLGRSPDCCGQRLCRLRAERREKLTPEQLLEGGDNARFLIRV